MTAPSLPGGADPARRVPVKGVSELVLEVRDLEAAERFYAGMLGLPVVERYASGEAIWLAAGDRTRIGLWLPQLGVAGGRGGAHVHFAFDVEERDFDLAVARLREAGLEPRVESRRRHRPTASRSAYVFDPDGNCVELWTEDIPGYIRRVTAGSSAAGRDIWWNQRNVRAHVARARLDAVIWLVGTEPGFVLDAAAGSGRLVAFLAERGWTVSGVDARPRLVELARARVPEAADRLIVGSADVLPFADCRFDAVVDERVLAQPDPEPALHELVRVLRPGGRAVLGLPNGGAPAVVWRSSVVHPVARAVKTAAPFGRRPPPPQPRPRSPERVLQLLGSVGLVVECIQEVGCEALPDPIDRVAPGLAYRAALRAEASPWLRRMLGTQRLFSAVKS